MVSLIRTLIAVLSAFIIFVASVATTLRLWSPLTCAPSEDGTCEFDVVLGFLGVALGIFVHGLCVAIAAWTPVFAYIRSQPNDKESPFDAFLAVSISSDLLAFLLALYLAIPNLIDTTMQLQIAVIAFNVPVAATVPYLLAAYRDHLTTIGGFLHRVEERMSERQLQLPTSASAPLFEASSPVEKQSFMWARS